MRWTTGTGINGLYVKRHTGLANPELVTLWTTIGCWWFSAKWVARVELSV